MEFSRVGNYTLKPKAKLDWYTIRQITKTLAGVEIEAECGTKLLLDLHGIEGRFFDLAEVTDEAFGKIDISLGWTPGKSS